MSARFTVAAAVLAAVVASPAAAQVGDPPRPTVQFGVAYETLSQGLSPWRSASLDASGAPSRNQVLYGAIRETTRFSMLDHEILVGFRQRVSPRVLLVVEGQASPSHHVSAAWDGLGQVEIAAGSGWNVQTGFRRRGYEAASVSMGTATVERYFSRYRTAYTLYVSHLAGVGSSASHRVHGDYYYGRLGSSIGASVAAGRELENVGPRGILRTDVRSAALVGQQWLTSSWFVRYDALVHDQGALYTRTRVSASLGHRF